MRTYGARLLIFSAVCAILALVALCLVLLVRTNQNQVYKKQTAENCRQINILKTAIVASVDAAERRALERDGLDSSMRQQITEYYAQQRMRFAPDNCPNP